MGRGGQQKAGISILYGDAMRRHVPLAELKGDLFAAQPSITNLDLTLDDSIVQYLSTSDQHSQAADLKEWLRGEKSRYLNTRLDQLKNVHLGYVDSETKIIFDETSIVTVQYWVSHSEMDDPKTGTISLPAYRFNLEPVERGSVRLSKSGEKWTG